MEGGTVGASTKVQASCTPVHNSLKLGFQGYSIETSRELAEDVVFYIFSSTVLFPYRLLGHRSHSAASCCLLSFVSPRKPERIISSCTASVGQKHHCIYCTINT